MIKPGVLLVLCISSTTGTDMCEMSATRISCKSRGTSSLLNQCSTGEDNNTSEFGDAAEAIRQYASHVRSQQCMKQLLTFADALANSSLWAVQMLDASAKTIEPDGYHLGHFDQCIDINLKGNYNNINGKYCLADVSQSGAGGSRMGICLPNECGYEEVDVILERYLSMMMKQEIRVRVQEYACVAKGSKREETGHTIFKYGVVGLVLWSVIITILDLISIETNGSSLFSSIWRKIVDLFSCYRHVCKLTSTRTATGASGIHLMRVATIFVLIVYQRHRLMIDGPVKNRPYLQKVNLSPWPIFDSLIFLTGFLTVQRLQSGSVTNTKLKCFLLCLTKWLRIMPIYGVAIAFYAIDFGDIGNGPLWVERIGGESRRCRDFWWANLSLVNNYISATGQCIAQSWFLAVISHGFVVTLIFMHLKTGKALVGLGSLAVSVIVTLVLFLWNDYAFHSLENPCTLDYLYIKTQYRLPAFLFGAATALLYHHVRQHKDKTTSVHFLTPFILTILALVSVLCHRFDTGSKMIFAVVSSLIWSFFIGCVILIFPLFNIGVNNNALLKNIFIPLSRLSYPALLSHNIIQLYTIGTMRTSEYVTFPRLAWMGIADIFASYISAFLSYLIIDGPVTSAIKIIFCTKGQDVNEAAEESPGKN